MKHKIRITEDEYTKTLYLDKGRKSKNTLELTNNVIIDFDEKDNIISVEVIK